MTTPLGCPRCHKEEVKQKSIAIALPTGKLDIIQNSCTNCGTRWFFEEDIYPIFSAAGQKTE